MKGGNCSTNKIFFKYHKWITYLDLVYLIYSGLFIFSKNNFLLFKGCVILTNLHPWLWQIYTLIMTNIHPDYDKYTPLIMRNINPWLWQIYTLIMTNIHPWLLQIYNLIITNIHPDYDKYTPWFDKYTPLIMTNIHPDYDKYTPLIMTNIHPDYDKYTPLIMTNIHPWLWQIYTLIMTNIHPDYDKHTPLIMTNIHPDYNKHTPLIMNLGSLSVILIYLIIFHTDCTLNFSSVLYLIHLHLKHRNYRKPCFFLLFCIYIFSFSYF